MQQSRRVFSPRASESASSPEPSPVQWFKSIKDAASHCILQGLVKSCNASPLCAKSICCFATRSEKWKRRVNLLHYTGTPLTSKVFVWNNKASLIRACENVLCLRLLLGSRDLLSPTGYVTTTWKVQTRGSLLSSVANVLLRLIRHTWLLGLVGS